MKTFVKLISTIAVSLGFSFAFSSAMIAQTSQPQGSPVSSAKTSDSGKIFVSAEGKFSIALPEAKGEPIAINLGIGRYIGKGFSWLTSNGSYTIYFADKPAEVRARSDPKILLLMRDPILWQIKLDKGKSPREQMMRLGFILGREYRWQTQDVITVIRTFVSGDRIYEITANVPLEDGKEKAAALKVLDTFKILSEGDIKKLIRQ